MRPALLVLVLAAGVAAPSAAQALYPGDPVRVSTNGRILTGELIALSADSLRLNERVHRGGVVDRTERSVALSDVEATYVRRPLGRHHAALRGALVGGALPALLAYSVGRLGPPAGRDLGDNGPLLLAAVIVGGAAIGAGVGALAPGGRWEPTKGVRVEPASAGLGVRATF